MQGMGRGQWRTAGAALAVLLVLSFIAFEPPQSAEEVEASQDVTAYTTDPETGATVPLTEGAGADPAAAAAGAAPGTPAAGAGGTTRTAAGRPEAAAAANAGLECRAGANGGETDRGVTGDKIKLAATNVRSGVGSSFLGTAFVGMQAVVNKVNAAGGVCGRLLELRLVDDGWDAARGASFIQNFVKDDVFALPVMPSSEGLTQAITNGTISNAGIPVIGSDGMLKEQYADPFVWPVATATVSTMRIMAKHAFDAGARSFGIVYDERYKFGLEGAAAFRDYVTGLAGAKLEAFVGITPGKSDYAGDAKAFNDACGGDGCEFVAMLLDPTTANTYISSQSDKDGRRQGFGSMLTGGAQPLFNERFARDCGKPCEGMLVWTGYNPPIGRLASEPDVATYVNDVQSVDPGVDENNQFLQGAYLGMRVFVHALEQVGPNLTRARLVQTMNGLQFSSGLSSPLQWAAGQRFANQTAQPFQIRTASGTFSGFAEAGGFRADPTPGVVPG